jgi:putative holliday junction resolvase
LVVGAPYNADGSPGALATAADGFAAELARRFGLPVKRVDERFSSLQASERLKAQRASGERRRRIHREDVDSAAAAVILERWLSGESDVR